MAEKGSGRSTSGRRIVPGILVVGILVILLAWASWMVLPKWMDKNSEPLAQSGAQTHSRRAEFRIDGMDCIMCAAGLQNSLRALPGVVEAEVSYQDGRAVVHFDPAHMDAARVGKAIEDAGFSSAGLDTPI